MPRRALSLGWLNTVAQQEGAGDSTGIIVPIRTIRWVSALQVPAKADPHLSQKYQTWSTELMRIFNFGIREAKACDHATDVPTIQTKLEGHEWDSISSFVRLGRVQVETWS